MSSRPDHRRRDRSWEKDDRDRDRYPRGGRGGGGGGGRSHHEEGRRRSSRSRSPRRGDRDRRGGPDRRDHRRDRDDERRDRGDRDRDRDRDRGDGRDRRDSRRGDDRDHERDDKKDHSRRDEGRSGGSRRPPGQGEDSSARPAAPPPFSTSTPEPGRPEPAISTTQSRPNLDPDAPDEEEGEAMDAVNDDDAAMMAMMGLSGFGSTKGKPVDGNQEGGVDVKKVRTWRQYMNRRGGFNRPLDKIK